MFAIPGGAFFEFGTGNSTSSWFELGGPPQFPLGPEVGLGTWEAAIVRAVARR